MEDPFLKEMLPIILKRLYEVDRGDRVVLWDGKVFEFIKLTTVQMQPPPPSVKDAPIMPWPDEMVWYEVEYYDLETHQYTKRVYKEEERDKLVPVLQDHLIRGSKRKDSHDV